MIFLWEEKKKCEKEENKKDRIADADAMNNQKGV